MSNWVSGCCCVEAVFDTVDGYNTALRHGLTVLTHVVALMNGGARPPSLDKVNGMTLTNAGLAAWIDEIDRETGQSVSVKLVFQLGAICVLLIATVKGEEYVMFELSACSLPDAWVLLSGDSAAMLLGAMASSNATTLWRAKRGTMRIGVAPTGDPMPLVEAIVDYGNGR